MAHNWQKWKKKTFLSYPCHEICRVEAVGLKIYSYTEKITIIVKIHTYIHEDIYIALLQEMYHSALQSRTRKTQLIIEQMSFECAFKRS